MERNQLILRKYIPEPAVNIIADWIVRYNFKLKIRNERASREGDYHPPRNGRNHLITVNRDLNPYAFLVTLIHEVAHLITWEKYGRKAAPHGAEWKRTYGDLLHFFLLLEEEKRVFPDELSKALHRHRVAPPAAGCTDLALARVLRNYDAPSSTTSLEKLEEGSSFRIAHQRSSHGQQVFVKGRRLRTRYKCRQPSTGKEFLVHALCRVIPVNDHGLKALI